MARKDLIPANMLSEEELKKMASNGGKKSVEVRRKKKTMRELMEIVLALPADEKIKEAIAKLGISKDEEITNNLALQIAMLREGLKGKVDAYNTIRDTIGEKPKEKVEIENKVGNTAKEIDSYIKNRVKGKSNEKK